MSAVVATLADSAPELARRTRVAWGHAEAELVLGGARVLLPTGEVVRADIGIVGARIAVVAPDLVAPGARRIDVAGKLLVPGYVEPHAHPLGPYSAGPYLGEALARGVTYVTSDDSHAYGVLAAGDYGGMLELSAALPLVLRWSLRPEPSPRRLTRDEALVLLGRNEVVQVGELSTHPDLRDVDAELARLLAGARNAGARLEGHNPGASARTLGVAAAAGVTADHEAISGAEIAARLRLGLWAFLRHNGLRPDVPQMVGELLEAGVPLERTGFTTDGATPSWIVGEGLIDAAIAAALGAGLPFGEAYAMATWRPATYEGVDAHLGCLAPGRLACVNVLSGPDAPRPERVISLGREVARDGALLEPLPDVPWHTLSPAPWTRRSERIGPTAYRLRPDDPVVRLESSAILRPGEGSGPELTCVVFDAVSERLTRARLQGLPDGWRALVSTFSPERLLVAIGSDPEALRRCVDAVCDAGGGIAFEGEAGPDVLPLPVGGAITPAPFAELVAFYARLDAFARAIGHPYPEPVTTLLFIADDGLPGARFVADGLIDVRSGEILRASAPVEWEGT